jgi:hypothetical protein
MMGMVCIEFVGQVQLHMNWGLAVVAGKVATVPYSGCFPDMRRSPQGMTLPLLVVVFVFVIVIVIDPTLPGALVSRTIAITITVALALH